MNNRAGRFIPQHQDRQPGREDEMIPPPQAEDRHDRGSGKLLGRKALITGGDSGIGRAVAIAFAKEGADVGIVYLEEHDDARTTARRVDELGQRSCLIAGDIGDARFARRAVARIVDTFGGLDIVVNNAAEQHPTSDFLDITAAQLERTFRTNVYGMFYVTAAALPHLNGDGCSIINTSSVTAYHGNPHLIDYSATKGAIVAFTRSLALALAGRNIRVAIAPGPIWTPLIPSTFDAEHVAHFGENVPLARPGQPEEVAPSFVFLASDDASYVTGQVLHPNGGSIVNG